MLVHSQGTFCKVVHFGVKVVHFGVNTTAPAVGLSRVPQKTTKLRYESYGTTCLFLGCTNPKKQNKKCHDSYSYVLVQRKKCYFDTYSTGKIKSNPLDSLQVTIKTNLLAELRHQAPN